MEHVGADSFAFAGEEGDNGITGQWVAAGARHEARGLLLMLDI